MRPLSCAVACVIAFQGTAIAENTTDRYLLDAYTLYCKSPELFAAADPKETECWSSHAPPEVVDVKERHGDYARVIANGVLLNEQGVFRDGVEIWVEQANLHTEADMLREQEESRQSALLNGLESKASGTLTTIRGILYWGQNDSALGDCVLGNDVVVERVFSVCHSTEACEVIAVAESPNTDQCAITYVEKVTRLPDSVREELEKG